MTSDQKYEGKGNTNQTSEQTAQLPPQTPISAAQRELAEHQKDADEGHLELFRTVEFYCGFPAESNPVAAINDILQDWLVLPTTNLPGNEYHRHRLHVLLETVNFITACKVHLKTISYYESEVELSTLRIARAGNSANIPTPVVPPVAPRNTINLPVCVTPAAPDQRSELTLLRDALQFYTEHLRQQSDSQQRPELLVDAASTDDILENLTAEAFSIFGQAVKGGAR